jgi:hypothetical protein
LADPLFPAAGGEGLRFSPPAPPPPPPTFVVVHSAADGGVGFEFEFDGVSLCEASSADDIPTHIRSIPTFYFSLYHRFFTKFDIFCKNFLIFFAKFEHFSSNLNIFCKNLIIFRQI